MERLLQAIRDAMNIYQTARNIFAYAVRSDLHIRKRLVSAVN
jgi:hypothetical protein